MSSVPPDQLHAQWPWIVRVPEKSSLRGVRSARGREFLDRMCQIDQVCAARADLAIVSNSAVTRSWRKKDGKDG